MSDRSDSAARFQSWFFKTVVSASLDLGMSDREVAARAEISPAYYSMMKNGRRSMSLSAMLKIGLALDLKIDIKLIPNK
jgi:transcriptional regulator with XRE-family HTH domain